MILKPSQHDKKSHWRERVYQNFLRTDSSSGQVFNANSALRMRSPYIKRIVAVHLPEDRNIRIVDLGCGWGAFLYFLRETGYRNIAGVDFSAQRVTLAHDLGIREVSQGEIIEYLGRIGTDEVDVILLMDVLEHLGREELFATLDEVHRVLRGGGKCIAHVPNGEGLFGMRVRYGDLTHEQAFSPESVRQLFQTVGFASVEVFEDKPIVHGWRSAVRRIVWELATVIPRIQLIAETGSRSFVLSQNLTVVSIKSR